MILDEYSIQKTQKNKTKQNKTKQNKTKQKTKNKKHTHCFFAAAVLLFICKMDVRLFMRRLAFFFLDIKYQLRLTKKA